MRVQEHSTLSPAATVPPTGPPPAPSLPSATQMTPAILILRGAQHPRLARSHPPNSESETKALFDLAAVDWGTIQEAFNKGRPRTAAQRLRSLLSARIAALVRLNPMRVDLVERFEKLVAEYNAGSINTERFFQELLDFKNALTEEEGRSLAEGLSEEQLAVFDLLMRPAPELSEDEKTQVKRVAEELLTVLKRNKIVLDWRKQQATRAAVRVAVEETLDQLPEKFNRQLYAQKCDAVYQHVFESYWDDGHSVYDVAA